ncbi:hypothetical protein OAJ95_04600 [Pelagibacteraceae bacterium]|nr:hypothetical protein [Pelagibacteraceae bacterium]
MINQLAPLPDFLVSRYKNWKSNSFLKSEDHFKNLASLGQNPSSMIIACCDSRVHVTSIFGADAGEFFIHRNIANLVPRYFPDGENHGTSAAIEYAVKELKVQHLIVLGHRDCGGIKSGHSLHSNNLNSDYEFINKWLSILLPAFNNIAKDVSTIKQIEELEEESIKNSVINLFSFPYIKKAVEDKKLIIHGLIYDIGSGGLKFLNPITEDFENI